MTRVLVTGGTGFIGQPLVAALQRRGWIISALVRSPNAASARALADAGCTLVPGDITQPDGLADAMRGHDIVVHNAAWYEHGLRARDEPRIRAINVDGTRHVLDAAIAAGASRIVYTSSIVVWGHVPAGIADESSPRLAPPPSLYEASKRDAHDLALARIAAGAPIIMPCPSAVIGTGDHSTWGWWQRTYVRGLMPPFAFGTGGEHAFSHVDDIAEGIALAAEKGRIGESYMLVDGVWTIQQIMDLWNSTPGGMRVRGMIPRWAARAQAAAVAPLLRLLGLPAFFSDEAVRSAYVRYAFTGEKARRELGWSPRGVRTAWEQTMAGERARLGKA